MSDKFKQFDQPLSPAGHNPYWCGGTLNGGAVSDDPCWSCIDFVYPEGPKPPITDARLDEVVGDLVSVLMPGPGLMVEQKSVDEAIAILRTLLKDAGV